MTGAPNSSEKLAELERHIRVLETACSYDDVAHQYAALRGAISQLERRVDQTEATQQQILGVLTDMLEAQRETAKNFALLLAGVGIAKRTGRQ